MLHFFTGLHHDYHRDSDRVEKINVTGMLRIIDLAEQVTRVIADDPEDSLGCGETMRLA